MAQTRTTAQVATATARQEASSGKDILRLLTCGSVDDGKSTLIGRLIFDLGQVSDDQLETLANESLKFGTTGEDLDLALLVDGLEAEREQGITIDVAYRYFETPSRKFIIADTPGHEQYTRNMATGASVSDLAVLLVDARKGILSQTRRHTAIAHLLGIEQFAVIVNKMDLVDRRQSRFEEIRADYNAFASQLGVENVSFIPVSAITGENVVNRGTGMPWYDGPTLIDHLDAVAPRTEQDQGPLLFPVQWVNRSSADFRGFSGTLAGGTAEVGQDVVVLPSGRPTRLANVSRSNGSDRTASAGDAVTVELADDIDVSRGDVIASKEGRPEITDQVSAHLIWLSEEALLPGRRYAIKCATQSAEASVTAIRHTLDVDTLAELAGRRLELNDIGICNLSFSRPLVCTNYEHNKTLGSFILIDKVTSQTVGAGMIRFGLRRAENVHWQALDINKDVREQQKGQRALCLWFTGLSGSGKSTIANMLERRLFTRGCHTYILDGDNVRHGLNRDLGFTEVERVENIRRVAEVAKLMVDAGLITIVSFISPFRAERQMARELFPDDRFIEVFVDTPLEICEQRDVKGLYKKAREGSLKNFTGIDSPYEEPLNAEVRIETTAQSPEASADQLVETLTRLGLLS